MASPLQAIMSLLQAPKPRQPAQMRPLEQILAGAQISPQRSQYERTMIPGEQRTAGDLQSMLGEVILAAGSMAVPGVGGRPVRQAPAARPRPSQAPAGPVEWVYHGTNLDRAREIAADKKLRTFRPNYGTEDQYSWPDGSTRSRAYFSASPEVVKSFQPEGTPAVLRVKRGPNFKAERYTKDIYSEAPVPAKDIEIQTPDGSWVPLLDWKP